MPVSNPAVPPPEVFQFTRDGFIKYLDYAHKHYRDFLSEFGKIVKGHHVGQCWWFFQLRGEMLGIVTFSDVPAAWQAMVNEYHAFRTETIISIEPINAACQRGGGTISEEDDQKIVGLFDRAQTRMYEMLNLAQSMP